MLVEGVGVDGDLFLVTITRDDYALPGSDLNRAAYLRPFSPSRSICAGANPEFHSRVASGWTIRDNQLGEAAVIALHLQHEHVEC